MNFCIMVVHYKVIFFAPKPLFLGCSCSQSHRSPVGGSSHGPPGETQRQGLEPAVHKQEDPLVLVCH